jgi:t-SNARE complex subunit (syntaxin)
MPNDSADRRRGFQSDTSNWVKPLHLCWIYVWITELLISFLIDRHLFNSLSEYFTAQNNIRLAINEKRWNNSVRENMNTTLTKKFIDEMKTYQQAQQKYKTDIKNKVKRQVQVVKPDATDEEINDIMKSEGGRDALYKQSILAGGVNDQIKYVVLC